MSVVYKVTIYTSPIGEEHEAVYVSWPEVERILGREHRGEPEDDRELVEALLAAGAPEWIRDAPGWVDENGWGLIGPTLEVEFEWEYEQSPDWDSSGTVAESWYATYKHYALQIDHFNESDGGGWAFTVTVNGNPIRGGENEDAASFDDAEEKIRRLIGASKEEGCHS